MCLHSTRFTRPSVCVLLFNPGITFYGAEDFEVGEDKTLIKVTQAVSEEAKNPSQASLAPELVFITSVSPSTEGKNTLATWY